MKTKAKGKKRLKPICKNCLEARGGSFTVADKYRFDRCCVCLEVRKLCCYIKP